MPAIEQHILDRIQPVVLVGGKSKRFGRDKLLEPIAGSPMVAVPINTLRKTFGPRVAIVGQCDPHIATLADLVINDPYPGLGPVGGLCAALESTSDDIFICAGDLISIDQATIHAIIQASIENPDTSAYLAQTDRLHPTIGLYRAQCVSSFKDAINQNKLKLGLILKHDFIHRVKVDPSATRNINRPDEL
jgi:molybdopterin-guanine dinucleotide biosynthesis protein A